MSFPMVIPLVSTTTSLARMKIDGIGYLVDPITCKAYTCDEEPTEVGVVTIASATEPVIIHFHPDVQTVLQTKRDALVVTRPESTSDATSNPSPGS